jgi:addiction module HigA family antidote
MIMAREPIHPGEILADELTELGISAAELARQIKVPANRISKILSGKRSITADTALRLGRWFGTGPKIWLNLQQAYDLDVAALEMGSDLDIIEPRNALVKQLPCQKASTARLCSNLRGYPYRGGRRRYSILNHKKPPGREDPEPGVFNL